jgi:peroxiredoxin
VKSAKSEFDRRAVSIAVISFADPAELSRYQNDHNWPFPIFSDPSRSSYESFGLGRLPWFRVFSAKTLWFYLRSLRARDRWHRYGTDDIYQGGGDFLIDRNGNVLFAYRNRNPADRPTAAKLLQDIDRLRERGFSNPSGGVEKSARA